MSYERITRTRYLCRCEHLDCVKHIKPWESDHIPDRCSGCKRTTWNGVDKRRGSFTRVRKGSKP